MLRPNVYAAEHLLWSFLVASREAAETLVGLLIREYATRLQLDVDGRYEYLVSMLESFDNENALAAAVATWIRSGTGWPPQTSDLVTLYDEITQPKYAGHCANCLSGRVFYTYGETAGKLCAACSNPAVAAIDLREPIDSEPVDMSALIARAKQNMNKQRGGGG